MKLTVTVDDGQPLVAHLNEDVKVSYGAGEFSITATYPTYDLEEVMSRSAAGERLGPVIKGGFK